MTDEQISKAKKAWAILCDKDLANMTKSWTNVCVDIVGGKTVEQVVAEAEKINDIQQENANWADTSLGEGM